MTLTPMGCIREIRVIRGFVRVFRGRFQEECRMRTIHWAIGVFLLGGVALPLSAESVNPPTRPQTAPMTAQEKKNLDMVMTWWLEVLYAGHFELAPKYQAEDYIQH